MSLGGNLWAIFRACAVLRPTPVKKCAHSKKKEENSMHFKRVSFSRLFVGEDGRGNINPFIAGGKEIDAFDDFFPSPTPPPSKRPFFAYLYNSRHTTSSPVAGKRGREKKSLFWGGLRRACFAWQTVEGRRDCVLAFLHENWGGRGGILLKPTVANYIEVTFLHSRYLKRRV